MGRNLGTQELTSQEPHSEPSGSPYPGTVLWCTQQVPSPVVKVLLLPQAHGDFPQAHRSPASLRPMWPPPLYIVLL